MGLGLFHHEDVRLARAGNGGEAGKLSKPVGNKNVPAGVLFGCKDRRRLLRKRPAAAMDDKRRRFEAQAIPHLDAATNLARWLARSHADADDIVQEAMLRAFRAFDGFRGAT